MYQSLLQGRVNREPFRSEMLKAFKIAIFVLLKVLFRISGNNCLCHPLVKLEKIVTSQLYRATKLSNDQSLWLLVNTAEKTPVLSYAIGSHDRTMEFMQVVSLYSQQMYNSGQKLAGMSFQGLYICTEQAEMQIVTKQRRQQRTVTGKNFHHIHFSY